VDSFKYESILGPDKTSQPCHIPYLGLIKAPLVESFLRLWNEDLPMPLPHYHESIFYVGSQTILFL
jgi:hypothetical protein